MGMLSKAKLALQNYRFKLWRLRHPQATFKDYFATIAKDDLARGHQHPSLGEHLKWGDRSELGGASFKRLLKYGITPQDVFVDYGCGTLRMGVHAIRFLERGRYWGFDIDQALLDEGARLIGPEMENKAPNLRVISAAAVREAAQAKPAFLFSLKVLIHVHPDELDEFFGNILTIIGTSGRAILTGKWSSGEPFQFARQSWAHSLERLTESVARHGGQLIVLKQDDSPRTDIVAEAKTGILEVRAAR
ncbi:MAG TPA: class I SAM-dependent methyltransferase [Hyphomicrobiaceae bacterium]|nr:class I SAM-dependent methyltransferase [Hyphomicrobiaceae bacterium]